MSTDVLSTALLSSVSFFSVLQFSVWGFSVVYGYSWVFWSMIYVNLIIIVLCMCMCEGGVGREKIWECMSQYVCRAQKTTMYTFLCGFWRLNSELQITKLVQQAPWPDVSTHRPIIEDFLRLYLKSNVFLIAFLASLLLVYSKGSDFSVDLVSFYFVEIIYICIFKLGMW